MQAPEALFCVILCLQFPFAMVPLCLSFLVYTMLLHIYVMFLLFVDPLISKEITWSLSIWLKWLPQWIWLSRQVLLLMCIPLIYTISLIFFSFRIAYLSNDFKMVLILIVFIIVPFGSFLESLLFIICAIYSSGQLKRKVIFTSFSRQCPNFN